MKNANNECQQLVARWISLQSQRASEMDFGQFGFPGVQGKHFEVVFTRWSETLSSAIAKTKPSNEAESGVADAVLARLFRDIRANIDGAHSNGVGWLLPSTPFLQLVADAQAYMTQYVERRISLRKELLKFAEGQLSDQLLTVEKAAPIAKELMATYAQIQDDAKSIDETKSAGQSVYEELKEISETAGGEISALKEKWEKSQEEIAGLTDSSKEAKNQLEAINKDAETTLAEAKELLDAVKGQSIKSDAAIRAGEELISQTNRKLTKALADINRQALAGAFDDQAKKVNQERGMWVGLFLFSIFILLSVASYHAMNGADGTFDYRDLLRSFPFAAPAVWLGWLSARQAGLLARIHQDYAYKAATAVAFEGYKKEVEASADQALTKQLLESTVKNFGENPIRIFSKSDDHVMPVEQLLATVKDDSTWGRVMDLIKVFRPSK